MRIIMLLLSLALLQNTSARDKQDIPKRLKRSESFLGVHFDFHAGEDSKEIGKNTDREMIQYIIDRVHPDYIQCDCKGHPGLSSYPTQAGNQAPGFVGDPLMIWRQVTAERGVALYMHYSGVYDSEAVKMHPDWARVNEEGAPDNRLTSVFGPYVDELLIPQLKELNDQYRVDGVWIDGECWATERDYCEKAVKTFQEKTGLTVIPKKPGDANWYEYSQFCRQGFRDYLNRYVTQMHADNPDFQIASNWAYSSMMPEPVVADVDFVSGDFSAQNSVNSARLEGRCFVHQGKPWDLMAWSFTWTDGLYSTKSVPQLQQEAAMVLALGGGFQAYFPQKRDGSIRRWQMQLMKETAAFCRARQSYCHRAEPVPQVGLIYSGSAFYRHNRKLFAAWSGELDPLNGILQALLESQNVVDILMEHHLQNRIQKYPVLVYPEWETIEPELKEMLLEYVKNGGTLLVIGPRSAKLFEPELGVTLLDEPVEKVNGLEYNNWIAGIKSLSQRISLGTEARAIGRIYEQNDNVGPYETAASVRTLGKGKIAAIYLNLGARYRLATTTVARDFLNAVIRELYPDPLVTVRGSHLVDVTLNKLNNRLMVNLVNTGGPHKDDQVYVFDEIPAVGPLDVTVVVPEQPKQVSLEPGHRAVDYRYKDGAIILKVQRLDLHDIIVIE